MHSVKPPDVLWAALHFAHSTPTLGSLKAPSVQRRTLVQRHLPISDDAEILEGYSDFTLSP